MSFGARTPTAAARTWLDVPYINKDLAKRLGAAWDPAARSWYAPVPDLPALRQWHRLPEVLAGEDRTYGQGLFVDMIPSTSWYENVRSAVSPTDWHRVSMMVRRRAHWTCEACGFVADETARLLMDAHERFSYNEATGVQRLVRLICLCGACHGATHYGHSAVTGEAETAMAHLQRVTGMTPAQSEDHLRDAFALWEHRSTMQWRLDLSVISGAGIAVREPRPVPQLQAVREPEPDTSHDDDGCPLCRTGGHDPEPGSLTITPRYF